MSLGAKKRRSAKRGAANRAAVEQEIAERHAWRRTAHLQRVCQHPNCSTPVAPWDGHHVIYEQEVLRRGWPRFDERNCLRLCKTCHQRHHSGMAPVPLSALKPHHIEYAREVLGDFHIDYLNRRYLPECPI